MSPSTIALIGARGHYGRILSELEKTPSLRVVGLSPGGDSTDPLESWCAGQNIKPPVIVDYRQMLDTAKPDIVMVCGAFELHAEMCVAAMDRGCHVITEKPAALTLEDFAKLQAAHRRNPNLQLAGMMFSRYDAGFYTAHQLIESGAIGEVRLLNARKSYRLGQRAGYFHDRHTYGGTIPWVGSHAIDWVMWFAGRRFASVFAQHSAAHNAGNGTMERSAACQFAFGDGVMATVSIDVFRPANAPSHGDDWARIVGTEGVIEARPDSINLVNAGNTGAANVPVGCDRTFLADFLAAIEGTGPTLLDTAATLDLTEACLLVRQSADEGRLIHFPA